MDMIEFSNAIPSEQLATIFIKFFNEHIAAYGVLNSVQFVNMNVITDNKSSITYSVRLLENEDKEKLLSHLNNITIGAFGKVYKPSVYLNGDILCVTFNK